MNRLLLGLALAGSLQAQIKLSSLVSGDTTTGFTVGRFIVTDSFRVPPAFGQYLSHATVQASGITLTTATAKTIDSLTLTPGEWDVTGVVNFTLAATTSVTTLAGSLSTTTNALGTQDATIKFTTAANVMTATDDPSWRLPTARFSVGANTKVYLVALSRFTVSTCKAYGTIRARRIG